MESRRVRLGDVVDDYCPRERRVTNHAVVAMIEDEIRQTRCAACHAEHPYKGARTLRRKKKDEAAGLSGAVLGGRAGDVPPADLDESATPVIEQAAAAAAPVEDGVIPAPTPAPVMQADAAASPADAAASPPAGEEGPVRRPLIRATLPRPEGQPAARPAPEFTMRQSGVRGGSLLQNDRGGNRPPTGGSRPPQRHHGQRAAHGQSRSHGGAHHQARHDRPHGHARGHRSGSSRGGKKRSH